MQLQRGSIYNEVSEVGDVRYLAVSDGGLAVLCVRGRSSGSVVLDGLDFCSLLLIYQSFVYWSFSNVVSCRYTSKCVSVFLLSIYLVVLSLSR